jgi:tight adherence protein C
MIFLAASAAILTFLLILILSSKRLQSERVKQTQINLMTAGPGQLDDELSKSFWERIVLPFLRMVASVIKKKRPRRNKLKKQQETRLDNDLRQAGMALTAGEFVIIRVMFTAALALSSLMFARKLTSDTALQFLVFLFALTSAVAIPVFYLRSRIRGRQLAIQNQMPNVMDVLSVSIEAGLGFDAALLKVIERFDGPLIDELTTVYREVHMGVSRRESLQNLARTSNVTELQTFATAIVQSEQYGTPVKNVLRQQAVQLRTARKQAAQEKGMKAPVRILLPMILLIFPVIFIILLGPTIISAIAELS